MVFPRSQLSQIELRDTKSLLFNLYLSIDTFLMAVAVGAACSFATPIGHQNNMIIYNIGKYKFSDYLKLGIPLEVVVFIVALISLLYFWPIYG